MKNIIIGTAGHIDHGKTTLIRALTGRETDTLKEEKDRGISINLGFTYFDLPSGRRAGIIDVPGHEKFVKNMLAGVSSVDVVMLVIAADEGIMPQTREHFEILQLLNVKKGIVVLTKADMVDEDWLSMIQEDVASEFQGTFLENAPVCVVDSKSKRGIPELISLVDEITCEAEAKDTEGHFRLPVDRSFSVSGFGTVVTGTVISGCISEGDTVEIYPSKVVTKVRGIQVHEQSVRTAEAGQRCALNLANVKTKDAGRGDVVSLQNLMEPSLMVDCKLYYLKSAGKPLENRQRVRLYHGTDEILCRVVILDKEEVQPGEEAFVQLRLEKPLTAQRNDRFVIRSYSPMHTIGGGSIIEPVARKAKQFNEKYIEELKIKESGKTESILENTVEKLSGSYPEAFDVLKAMGKNVESIDEKLQELVEQNRILKLDDADKPVYIHVNFVHSKTEELTKVLSDYHKTNSLVWGISKEEIKSRVFGKGIKQKIYDELLQLLEQKNIIKLHGKFVSLHDFQVVYNKDQERMKKSILDAFKKAGYTSPKYEDLASSERNKGEFKKVFDALLMDGLLVKANEECIFERELYEQAKENIIKHIKASGSITAGECRDILGTTRKYAVGLMEHLDNIKITKRIEDKRVLA